MPKRLATASAVVRLSPVSMTTRTPAATSALSASGVRGLDRIGDGDDAGRLAVDGRGKSRWRRPGAAARLPGRAAAVSILSSARNFALPSASRLPSTMPITPLPAGASKPRTVRQFDLALGGGRDDRRRQRMLAAALDAGSEAQHLRLVEAGQRDDRHHLRLAFGERAGLVDHQRVDLLHAFERLGVLDQHAQLRAAADADHDRHRRGEAERAGAGDDQHAHGGDQPEGKARFRPERRPGGEGDKRDRDHRRHEPAGDLIGQPLDRRAAALRRSPPSARSAPAACRGRLCRRASRSCRC